MKITGLSHLFKWELLHNWWLTKYFFLPHCTSTPFRVMDDGKGKSEQQINNVSFEPLIWFSTENTGCSIYMLTHRANMTATLIEVECGKCAVSDQVSTSQD